MQPVAAASENRLSLRLMGVALVSAIVASTCCVIPLLLVLVGITGAWMVNLTALKPLTPFFTVIAIAAIAWAGYLIYRPSTPCATPDETRCDTVRPSTRKIFLACAIFILLLLSFPLIAPLFY
jgi:mercuric ion transport protein